MKINETQRLSAIHSYHKNRDNISEPGIKRKEKRRDEVQISSEAKELLGTQRNSGTGSATKQRLEELRQSVSAGTYHVDARKIAEKLLPYIRD